MADDTSPLDKLLHSTSAKTLQYERQLKELEVSTSASIPALPYPRIVLSQSSQNT